tara:strand:- start:1832 stop:2239 length:408 start_codon:yes stop_codon:yes gene_type:complete
MSKEKPRIGWQKYEDLLEQQMSSPLMDLLTSKFAESSDQESDDDTYEDEPTESTIVESVLPVSQQLLEDMAMLTNFDCWMGHTNFDITKDIKEVLNEVRGIELMRVCSRYRFFIGVGKMFDFKAVRKDIEEAIIP